VRLVRDGLTNKQIASALHYSPKTVEVYLSHLYAKTQCSSRVERARALDGGTVELPVE
jgi:DNA-binding NarL/FixJ family response regulator